MTSPLARSADNQHFPLMQVTILPRDVRDFPPARCPSIIAAIYRCDRQARGNVHDRKQIERCGNSRIGTHILEGKVLEMIGEIMLDPAKLRGCIEEDAGLDDRSTARELAKIARKIGAFHVSV
jgi:hypothetical protein